MKSGCFRRGKGTDNKALRLRRWWHQSVQDEDISASKIGYVQYIEPAVYGESVRRRELTTTELKRSGKMST